MIIKKYNKTILASLVAGLLVVPSAFAEEKAKKKEEKKKETLGRVDLL